MSGFILEFFEFIKNDLRYRNLNDYDDKEFFINNLKEKIKESFEEYFRNESDIN